MREKIIKTSFVNYFTSLVVCTFVHILKTTCTLYTQVDVLNLVVLF